MRRLTGWLALALAGIAFAGCIAGVIVIWAARSSVLQSSAELLDAADGSLMLVEEKASRADELVKGIRAIVEPVAGKILQLADKIERTPQDVKDLTQIDEQITERLHQVDSIVEAVQTAAAILNKTSQLAGAVRLPASHVAGGPAPDDDARESAKSLAKVATKLQTLHEEVARLRERRQGQKDAVADAIRGVRDVDDELQHVDDRLQRVRTKAALLQAEVAEMRINVPRWINWATVIGSLILAWMGLGQFALLQRAWEWTRRNKPTPVSAP